MSPFLDALDSGRVLLMDGAMGTELQRAGLQPDECGEIWNLTHPERVRAVHQAYVQAGADVLLTNTFQANRPALARCRNAGPHRVHDYLAAAKQIIAPFISTSRFALASIGPIVEPPEPAEFPRLGEVSQLIDATGIGGPEFPPRPLSGILLETCSSPRVRFAVKRAIEQGAPVLLSLTYQRAANGKITTFSGHTPEWFARRAKQWGISALGVNCGLNIGMSEIIEIVGRYRHETKLPLFARPNAGTPTRQGEQWVYPHSAESMTARLPELIDAGATMIGGCCGTTPEYIAAFRRVIR